MPSDRNKNNNERSRLSTGLQTAFSTLSGSWVLDRSRSQPMEPHLTCMGVADLAIEAQAKCEADNESRHVILMEGDRFLIHKHTKINILTEHYIMNIEKVMTARNGLRSSTVRLRDPNSHSGVVITTDMPTTKGDMHQVETKQLLDNGHTMLQEIKLKNCYNGNTCSTRRVWVRVPMTQDDRTCLEMETPPLAGLPGMPPVPDLLAKKIH